MKKWLLAAILISLAILIAVVVFLIVRLPSLYSTAETGAAKESAQNSDILEYAKQKWPEYQISYDSASEVLTLSKETLSLYDDVYSNNGGVYQGELAPETYHKTAVAFANDVGAHCGSPSLSVTLCYLSKDGKPIFTVNSGGEIWTCWETNEPQYTE